MSLALATPCSTIRIASNPSATPKRLEANPGTSWTTNRHDRSASMVPGGGYSPTPSPYLCLWHWLHPARPYALLPIQAPRPNGWKQTRGRPGLQTDMIGQLQWSQGVVIAQLHRRIYVFGTGYTLLDHTHCFQSKRHAQTAGSKPGDVLDYNRLLAQALHHVSNGLNCIITRSFPDHYFNQTHDVD